MFHRGIRRRAGFIVDSFLFYYCPYFQPQIAAESGNFHFFCVCRYACVSLLLLSDTPKIVHDNWTIHVVFQWKMTSAVTAVAVAEDVFGLCTFLGVSCSVQFCSVLFHLFQFGSGSRILLTVSRLCMWFGNVGWSGGRRRRRCSCIWQTRFSFVQLVCRTSFSQTQRCIHIKDYRLVFGTLLYIYLCEGFPIYRWKFVHREKN